MKQASRDTQVAVPLAVFLGERLRWQRESRKIRQDEVAALARRWGFNWTQATVATVEAGRRRLSLEEFLMLGWIAAGQGPDVAKRGAGALIELAELFPVSIGDQVILNRRFTIDGSSIAMILSGRAKERGIAFADVPHGTRAGDGFMDQVHAGTAENEAVLDCLWPGAREKDRGQGGPLRDLLEAAHADKLGDAEGKAARRLRTFPLAVAAAARKRWGRSFTEERDARVERRIGLDNVAVGVDRAEQRGLAHPLMVRLVQAHRGHVSRVLIDELRQEGIEGLKPKRISKKRQKAIDASWRRAIRASAERRPPRR